MIAETPLVGTGASRDGRYAFCLPGQNRFRDPNTAEGYNALVAMILKMPSQLKVGFEGRGDQKGLRAFAFPNGDGQEWVLWSEIASAEGATVQVPPAQSEPSCRHAFETGGEQLRAILEHAGKG
ncbi:hypothetical protein P775_13090 [Puniceibacterium antarcticum]|uniref:Uncharacterized protein n=1 Tax=Puniceibacterium antarcticum TaxID=1206336 RepID=A0A2G8RDW0_9RHOB|nr:hypothetical protein P775_13090 [Puniceibacterium antarcticum]